MLKNDTNSFKKKAPNQEARKKTVENQKRMYQEKNI